MHYLKLKKSNFKISYLKVINRVLNFTEQAIVNNLCIHSVESSCGLTFFVKI
jgi:hypothetical protein